MKHIVTFVFFIMSAFSLNAQYDRYFTDEQLRFDYFMFGNADTSVYAYDKMLREPLWGGSKTNLIDVFNYGNYKVEVLLHDSDVVLYSRGYCTLSGEWQTTEESRECWRGFPESVVVPFPKETVDIVLYKRGDDGLFAETFRHTVNPEDYFIRPANKQPYDIFNVCGDVDPTHAVDIVILPDGYSAEEMDKFKEDCTRFAEIVFSYQPYTKYKDKFNIRAILAPSIESGVDEPGHGIYRSTVLNSSFYTFDTERYCMTYDNNAIRDLAGMVPYDQIYILANSKTYGGGGIFNFYSLSSAGNNSTPDVIIHEFGHAFAGLADEYYDDSGSYEEFYKMDVEPWEPNITTLVDFESKWKDMLDRKTPVPTPDTEKYDTKVGVYEGGGYEPKGVYRPKRDCLMKSFRGHVFCEVCTKAIERMILFYSE